jgi:hypothetical protein
MKRMIFVVTLVAIVALAMLGVNAINTSASQATADQAPTAAIRDLPRGLMLASDPPLCPPGVPPPCG